MSTDERRALPARGMFDEFPEVRGTSAQAPLPAAQAEKRGATVPRNPAQGGGHGEYPRRTGGWAGSSKAAAPGTTETDPWRWWMVWKWSSYHWFAAIWWALSWLATYQAVVTSTVAFPWLLAILVATIAQVVLTVGERPIMRSELVSWREDWLMRALCLLLLLLDTALNTGGLIPFVRALLATPLAAQLREINITPTMSPWLFVGSCVILGMILAIAPEVSYRHAERQRVARGGEQ